jgi:hypothetical protein
MFGLALAKDFFSADFWRMLVEPMPHNPKYRFCSFFRKNGTASADYLFAYNARC